MVKTIDAGRSETVETRRNLVTNAAFAVNTSGWSFVGGGGAVATLQRVAVALPGAPVPYYMRAMVGTAGTWYRVEAGNFPVTAGLPYTLSGYVRAAPTVSNFRLLVQWRNSTGGLVAESSSPDITASVAVVRQQFTATAPEGAVSARVQFGPLSGAVGDFFDLAAVMFEQSPTMGAWFYGATPNAAPYSYAFVGPANASASIQQLTRQVRVVPRLVDGFEASREVRNMLHPVLNRASPDVSFREPGLRSGEFRCLIESQADALYAFDVLSVPQVFTISDPEAPAVDMLFVVAPGELRIELDDETRKVWWLVVPFQEVES